MVLHSLLLIHSGENQMHTWVVQIWLLRYSIPFEAFTTAGQTNASDILVPCRLCRLEDCVCVWLLSTVSLIKRDRQQQFQKTSAHKEFLCFFPLFCVWLVPTACDVIRKIPFMLISYLFFNPPTSLRALDTLGWSCCDITHSHLLPLAS